MRKIFLTLVLVFGLSGLCLAQAEFPVHISAVNPAATGICNQGNITYSTVSHLFYVCTDGTHQVPSNVGTTTNDDATAGSIGEFVTATVATGSSVSLTTATPANVISISLTAGDWDVRGVVDYTAAATTSITNQRQGVSTTSATLGAQDTFTSLSLAAQVPTAAIDSAFATPVVRLSLAATTTVYLVTNATFTVSTLKAYGTISARRVR